jgi:hypothetical protein
MSQLRKWVAVVCLLCVVKVARAEAGAETEKQVARMNKRAMEDYDALEFESARKTLVDAVALLRSAGLDEAPIAAKTYLNLGIIFISGFKDKNRGVQQLVAALRINPNLKLDPALATPELDEAFVAAQKQATKEGRPPAETAKPPAEEVKGLQHQPIEEAKPGAPITVKADLGADSGATKVILFYRSSGQEDFVAVPMKASGGTGYAGVIPAEAVAGRTLQYYLEARDARGRATFGSGSAPNPYLITITEGGGGAVPEVDVEDPLMREKLRKKRAAEDKGKRDHLFLFVMPGFGFGYQPGGNQTEVAWQYQGSMLNTYAPASVDKQGGVAIAPFHIAVELGWMITHAFSLSVLGRFQVYTGANAQTIQTGMEVGGTTKSSGAVAAMLRARYRFLSGKVHPYLHLDFGGGEIRNALNVSGAQGDPANGGRHLIDYTSAQAYNSGDTSLMQEICVDPNNCYDTIKLGYLFVGGGLGVWYDFAKHFALIVDVNLLGALGLGNAQRGMNIDFQIGVGAHFL